MDEKITAMLASLNKSRRAKQLTVKVSQAEFMDLQNFCAQYYTSYSEVVRLALNQYLKTK
jgi:hypothetical protein